jgi:Cytidylate kinase
MVGLGIFGRGCRITEQPPFLYVFGAADAPGRPARRGERGHQVMQRTSSDEALARLADCLDPHRDGVTIVAVDGHSAAGKSTFAARIAARFDAAVVEVDAVYRVLDPHVCDQLDARGGVDQYHDWQRLRKVLATIRAGRAAAFKPYGWDRNQLSTGSKNIDAARLAVVNGVPRRSVPPDFRR